MKILKLQHLFHLKFLTFVYQCVNKISPPYFHSFFNLVDSVRQYGTRQATRNDIFLTHKNTTQYGIRSLRNFGAKMWNDIPVGIKSFVLIIQIIAKGGALSSIRFPTERVPP